MCKNVQKCVEGDKKEKRGAVSPDVTAQPQPIATEADTGINAFNLGQPFFAINVVIGKTIIMDSHFLELFDYLTYDC